LYGKAHGLSRFQVSDTPDFSNIVYDSGEIAATETHDVPEGNLLESTNYYWRAYYEDVDGAESELSDAFEFTTSSEFFDPADPANIGASFAGGFIAGVIDTIQGTIDSADDYQTGERYVLVVSPKEYEGGNSSLPASGLPTGNLQWDSQDRSGESGAITRWNGLESTDTILEKNDSNYQVFEFIRSLRQNYPAPDDGGSDWYLPAMDELEIVHRNLKPVTADNGVDSRTFTFPGTQNFGENPSSEPQGTAYNANDPSQTSVTEFQVGGTEAVDLSRYWSSTDTNQSDSKTWFQVFNSSAFQAFQSAQNKSVPDASLRPVRRVPL